jgi:hypothetical protein
MTDHRKSVINALNEWKRQSEGSDQSAIERIVKLAAEVNRERFAASLEKLGSAMPFRKDERSREQRIADVSRLIRLVKQNRRRTPEKYPHPPSPPPSGCESGWSSILRDGDQQFSSGSALVVKPANESLPPDQNGGYSGTSARAFASNSSISIGAVIGDFCDINWTPPDQRVYMGVYEGAAISASWSVIYELAQPLSARAPNALMARADVLRTLALLYMVAGDPNGPGGGFIWCYATASLDLYIGSQNLTGRAKLPHGFSKACLWNRMGSPFFDGLVTNGINGTWDTKIDVLDDGDTSNPELTASIGGTTSDNRVLVVVSVNVCCLRYPGDDGFVGVSFAETADEPLVVTPDTAYEQVGGYLQNAPIQVQRISLCGI